MQQSLSYERASQLYCISNVYALHAWKMLVCIKSVHVVAKKCFFVPKGSSRT